MQLTQIFPFISSDKEPIFPSDLKCSVITRILLFFFYSTTIANGATGKNKYRKYTQLIAFVLGDMLHFDDVKTTFHNHHTNFPFYFVLLFFFFFFYSTNQQRWQNKTYDGEAGQKKKKGKKNVQSETSF